MEANVEEELFKIDIDADETQNKDESKRPDYFVDHFMIKDEEDGLIVEEIGKDSPSSEKCWNCDKIGHSLRECPLPHNRSKILQAKKSFTKAQTGSKRYHDNKFAKFRPGFISDDLREALGLRRNELPTHIYMMRVLGYPPGWLHEAKISNSGIKMYNDRGKRMPEPGQEDGEILNKIMKYDVEKIVEYPGFNVKIGKSMIDDYKMLGFPPMRSEHKLKNYIKYLEDISNKEEDISDDSTDDEVIDMELSEMLPSQIIDEVRHINKRIGEIDKRFNRSTDSLEEGEIDTEDTTKNNEESIDNLEEGELEDETINNQNQESPSDIDQESNSNNEQIKRSLPIDVPGNNSEHLSTPKTRGSVTSTSFGTPHCKSHSPYSSLPSFNNFNKDISDVIDFENLPDSVGKYDTMCSIISKIRNYMTSKTNKNEDKTEK